MYESVPDHTSAELNAGTLHGFSHAQVLAIYDTAVTISNLLSYVDNPIALCLITEVEAWVSRGPLYLAEGFDRAPYHAPSLPAGTRHVCINCKAIRISTVLRDIIEESRTAGVFHRNSSQNPPAALQQAADFLNSGYVPQIQFSSTNPFFWIEILDQSTAEISFDPFSNSTNIGQTVSIKVQYNELRSYLSHIAMYLNIVDYGIAMSSQISPLAVLIEGVIRGQNAPADDQIDQAEDYRRKRPGVVFSFPHIPDPLVVADGDQLQLRVKNDGGTSTVYVEVLYIEVSECISRIFPKDTESPIELGPGASVPLNFQVHRDEQVAHNIRGVNYDTVLVLATSSEQCHFPEEVLPELAESQAELDAANIVGESATATRASNLGFKHAAGMAKLVNIQIV